MRSAHVQAARLIVPSLARLPPARLPPAARLEGPREAPEPLLCPERQHGAQSWLPKHLGKWLGLGQQPGPERTHVHSLDTYREQTTSTQSGQEPRVTTNILKRPPNIKLPMHKEPGFSQRKIWNQCSHPGMACMMDDILLKTSRGYRRIYVTEMLTYVLFHSFPIHIP